MKTYLLNLYYASLHDAERDVRIATEFVKEVSGNNWRVIRAGKNLCSLAFSTDSDPDGFQNSLLDIEGENAQYLLVELSAVHAGWTDESVYQWLQGRLRRG